MAELTIATTRTSQSPRRLRRSAGALVSGFFTVVVLSLGTDQVLHSHGIYPPWGQPMYDPGLNAVALSYRIVYSVLGCYLAARLAPSHPMGHALALGIFGLVPSIAGVIVAMNAELGPTWYPLGIVFTSVPTAWLGGALYRARHHAR